MRRPLLTAALSLAGLALAAVSPALAAGPLDGLGEQYARLQLEIGAHEDGYIDAFYGPAAWKTEAEARKRDVPAIRADVEALKAKIDAVPAGSLDEAGRTRRAFLLAHLTSADTRLRMMGGEKLAFRDEAEGLMGWRPDLKPLSAYDPYLARIEKIVPGEGDLATRVDAFKSRYVIPKDKLDAVMRAGIAECRKRSAAHIALPADESFALEFVTNKSWSGYNWFKGGHHSLIQINTDLPIYIDRATDLGCHEGYPGHHEMNTLIEARQVEGKGWTEMTVYPLYSPASFIAEGSGNYGIDLAFPGKERLAFEKAVLYPLAGLDPATADAYDALRDAQKGLANARVTIAADYLDGKIDRETAIGLLQKYQLTSRQRAEQGMAFIEQYRSYVINYGMGQDAVGAYVERAGASQAARWKAFEHLIGDAQLPSVMR